MWLTVKDVAGVRHYFQTDRIVRVTDETREREVDRTVMGDHGMATVKAKAWVSQCTVYLAGALLLSPIHLEGADAGRVLELVGRLAANDRERLRAA